MNTGNHTLSINSLVFVHGAMDPEMEACVEILRSVGAFVAPAIDPQTRKPVSASTAYKAVVPSTVVIETENIVCLECDVQSGKVLARLDHHRPGDPGFEQPPAAYFEASTLGQLIRFLVYQLGVVPPGFRVVGPPSESDGFIHTSRGIQLKSRLGRILVPQELSLTAAADHCLAAAYAGECPGVDPLKLEDWRIQSRASFQKLDPDELRARIRKAKEVLYSHCKEGLADVRHLGFVPELPEAAAQTGIPFIAEVLEKGGLRKVVLQAAPPELIRRFLDGELVPGLVKTYGDPARGFAGGYVE